MMITTEQYRHLLARHPQAPGRAGDRPPLGRPGIGTPSRTAGTEPRAAAAEGIGLIASILTILLISVVGAALLASTMADVSTSANYRSHNAAFYAADSGLEQTLFDYLAERTWIEEVVETSLPITIVDPFPDSVTINGQTVTLDTSGGEVVPGFYPLGDSVPLGDGAFARELWLPPTGVEIINAKGTKADVIIPVRSTGDAGVAEASTVGLRAESLVTTFWLSVWDNAVFAGAGQGGDTVNGNVQVRGSIHVVGDPNDPTEIYWSGGAGLLNNYADADSSGNFGGDAVKLPPLPTREWNDETVQSLDAEFRVKHGSLYFDGTVDLGESDAGGNGHKETLDGVWVDGDVVPMDGNAQMYADDEGDYDLGDAEVPFPTLDDPYVDPNTGTLYATHRDYLNTVGLTLPVNEISASTAAFSYSDASGNSISWNPATKTLEIEGIVRVDGDLTLGRTSGPPESRDVLYSGTGTLYATNDLHIVSDVKPVGDYLDTSQSVVHNLGLIADRTANIATADGASWIKLFAAVYAEESVRVAKQTRVAGALVSNFFDLGTDVPRIFQVPKLASNLPPAMPGGDPLLFVTQAGLRDWYQVR